MTMRLDGKRWVSMPTTVLVAILTATVSAAVAVGTLQSDWRAAIVRTDGHEVRIQRIETKIEDLREMKNDISWIKQTMERERRMAR